MTFVVLLVLVIIGFVFAIRFFLKMEEPLNKTARLKTRSLLFTMRMQDTRYSIGEPIHLLLEVRNISPKPIMLKFNESLEYDFLVQKEVNLLFVRIPMSVWRFSAAQAVSKKKHTITLQPQEVKVFKAVWHQKDFRNRQVGTGLYIIKGTINIAGKNTELQMRGKMGKK